MSRSLTNEMLFWAHALLVVLAVVSAFIFPLWVIVLGAAVHRVHLYFFKGCLFTMFQRRTGGVPHELSFFQHASLRLFGSELTREGLKKVDLTLTLLAIGIALVRHVMLSVV